MELEKCLRCKKRINLEVDINKKYYSCPACNVMVANPNYPRKLKIYISAGWFDEYQEKALEFLETNLFKRSDFEVYSPRKELALETGETFTKEVKQKVFNANLESIKKADLIISSTVGKDMGTLFEDGFAFSKDKPIIYTFFDDRFGNKIDFNLMLSESSIAAFTDKQEFLDFIDGINKQNYKTKKLEYSGAIE